MERLSRANQIKITERLQGFLHYWNTDINRLAMQIGYSLDYLKDIFSDAQPMTLSACIRIVGSFGWEAERFLLASEEEVTRWRRETTPDTVYLPINQTGIMRDKINRLNHILNQRNVPNNETSSARITAIRAVNGRLPSNRVV